MRIGDIQSHLYRLTCYVSRMGKESERLRRARIEAGYSSAAEAARAFGWKEATYRHHENATRGFDIDHAKSYARAFRVRSAWLFGVEDDPQLDRFANSELSLPLNVVGEFTDNFIETLAERAGLILISETKKSDQDGLAGSNVATSGNGYAAFSRDLLSDLYKTSPDHIFSFEVDGNAMSPTIKDGARILVDGGHTVIDTQDDLWLFQYDHAPIVRRVRSTGSLGGKRHLTLSVDGGAAAPLIIDARDIEIFGNAVLGKVVWIGQKP